MQVIATACNDMQCISRIKILDGDQLVSWHVVANQVVDGWNSPLRRGPTMGATRDVRIQCFGKKDSSMVSCSKNLIWCMSYHVILHLMTSFLLIVHVHATNIQNPVRFALSMMLMMRNIPRYARELLQKELLPHIGRFGALLVRPMALAW